MRRILMIFMMLSCFIVLASCSNRSDDSSFSYQFISNEQSFEIVSLYNYVLQYTAQIKNDPTLDSKIEYEEKVFLPFYELAKKKNVVVDGLQSFFVPTLIENVLEENTLLLLSKQDEINAMIEEAIMSSSNLLSGGDKTIFVLPFHPDKSSIIRDMKGATGYVPNEKVMLLQIDPSFSEESLKYVVAHEYNHMIAMESLTMSDNNSLLASIILEGKADSFAEIVYPDYDVPWLDPPLTAEEERIIVDEISNVLDAPFYTVYGDLFMGNYNKGIPRWSNYKLGYNIMQSFLKNNPELTIDEWTRLGAKEILQGSDYRDFQSPIHGFSYGEQNFEIISLYEEVLTYTAQIKNDPSLDHRAQYDEKVFMPFYNLAKERDMDADSFYSFFTPTQLEQQLEDNTIELLRNQKKINELIREAIVASAEWIPGGDTTIFVMPFNPDNPSIIKDMEGVAGGTLNNAILLQIDPSFSEAALLYTVAHEYNHAIAMKSREVLDYSLLNLIVQEGKADSFAGILYPEKKVSWLEPYSSESEKIVLNEINEHLDIYDADILYELLIGNYNKGIPRWSNYKLGYNIMQSFLKNNPELTIDEWTKLGPWEIVQESEYRFLKK